MNETDENIPPRRIPSMVFKGSISFLDVNTPSTSPSRSNQFLMRMLMDIDKRNQGKSRTEKSSKSLSHSTVFERLIVDTVRRQESKQIIQNLPKLTEEDTPILFSTPKTTSTDVFQRLYASAKKEKKCCSSVQVVSESLTQKQERELINRLNVNNTEKYNQWNQARVDKEEANLASIQQIRLQRHPKRILRLSTYE